MESKLLLAGVLIVSLLACNTAKRAEKQVNKALTNHPGIVAKIARNAFPCVPIRFDTTITDHDTTILIDCPDYPISNSADYFYSFSDTVRDVITKVVTKVVRVPVTLPVRTVTIIKTVEDSAKLKVANVDLSNKDKSISVLSGKVKKKNSWLIGLWIAVAVLASPYIFKFIKMFV